MNEGIEEEKYPRARVAEYKVSDDLERLFFAGRLRKKGEPQSAAERRVAAGRALQDLGWSYRSSGGKTSEIKIRVPVRTVQVCEIGTEKDIAETMFLRIRAKLGHYAPLVYGVCFYGGIIVTSWDALCAGLDRLPSAMEEARGEIEAQLESEQKAGKLC